MKHFVILVAIIIVAGFELFSNIGPDPTPIDADPNVFSATRAFTHVETIAANPRPMGSSAARKAAVDIQNMFADIGVTMDIWSGDTAPKIRSNGRLITIDHIENIVGRIRGANTDQADASKAILLMAHYDTVSMSAGASDDALGISVIIEAVRAFLNNVEPEQDIIVLLTDGEEEGLLGARAFFAQHPWADDIGLVINLDNRGSSGPVRLMQTSPGNGELVGLYGTSSPTPRGNGVADMFGALSPDITDTGPALGRGIAVMNFAVLEGVFAYHSAIDTVDRVSLRTLQDMGDQTLALLLSLNGTDIASGAAQATYFDLFGSLLVNYPAYLNWIPILAGFVLLVGAYRAAPRDAEVSILGLIKSAAFHIVWLFIVAGVLLGLSMVLGNTANFEDQVDFKRYLIAASEFGVSLAFIAGGLMMIPTVWRSQTRLVMSIAGLFLVLVVAILLQATFPQASYFLALPAFLMALAIFADFKFGGHDNLWGGRAKIFAGFVAILLIVPTAMTMFTVVGLILVPVIAFFIAFGVWIIGPLLATDAKGKWRVLTLMITGGAISLVWFGLTTDFDEDHPRSVDLMFVEDVMKNQAYWATQFLEVDGWTMALLGETPSALDVSIKPYGRALPLYGRMAERQLDAQPSIDAVWRDEGGDRHAGVTLNILPRQSGDEVRMAFDTLPAGAIVRLDGEILDVNVSDGPLYLAYRALPMETGLVLELDLPSGYAANTLDIRLVSISQGLADEIADHVPDKPSNVMPVADLFGSWTTVSTGAYLLPVPEDG